MNKVLCILMLLVLTSCGEFKELEFNGSESFKYQGIKGRNVSFIAGAKISNQNGFAIKVKPSVLDVYIEDEQIGKLSLDKKVRIKRKSNAYVEGPFTLELEQGALFKSAKYLGSNEVQVRLKGDVKTGVWFISKKLSVDESKKLSGDMLRLPQN